MVNLHPIELAGSTLGGWEAFLDKTLSPAAPELQNVHNCFWDRVASHRYVTFSKSSRHL